MQPMLNDKDNRALDEKERQMQITDRKLNVRKRTLTEAMNELFPVRKCSVSRSAARAAIRYAYQFHRVQRGRGRATKPSHPSLSHADEMQRRKIARTKKNI